MQSIHAGVWASFSFPPFVCAGWKTTLAQDHLKTKQPNKKKQNKNKINLYILDGPGTCSVCWPQTQSFTYLYLQKAGIKSVYHQAQLTGSPKFQHSGGSPPSLTHTFVFETGSYYVTLAVPPKWTTSKVRPEFETGKSEIQGLSSLELQTHRNNIAKGKNQLLEVVIRLPFSLKVHMKAMCIHNNIF